MSDKKSDKKKKAVIIGSLQNSERIMECSNKMTYLGFCVIDPVQYYTEHGDEWSQVCIIRNYLYEITEADLIVVIPKCATDRPYSESFNEIISTELTNEMVYEISFARNLNKQIMIDIN